MKTEREQLSGSAKYRMVYHKLSEAIGAGRLTRDMVVCEASAGSTGVALAYAANALGLRCEVHIYEGTASVKVARMNELGAHIVEHGKLVSPGDVIAMLQTKASAGSHWYLGQYQRQVQDCYRSLALELFDQCREAFSMPRPVFVCPVGTGGLIQGVGRVLREVAPNVEIVALEPEPGARIDGIRNTKIMNMGAADPYDPEFVDSTLYASTPGSPSLSSGVGESSEAALTAIGENAWTTVVLLAPD